MGLIGLISDIHSNFVALNAVLTDMMSKYEIEEIWCTGDIVGYYATPKEVLEVVRKYCFKDCIVKGNHDDAVAKGYTIDTFNDGAALGIQFSLGKLSSDDRKWLNNLPSMVTVVRAGKKIMLVHGSPNFPLEEYIHVQDTSKIQGITEFMDYLGIDLLLLGHTHFPYVLHKNGKTIVNSGSVGQPRDGNPNASYTVIDPEKWIFSNERVPYDIKKVQQQVYDAHLPVYLAKRLETGK